jgi:uncharacterized protein (UPF0276 family)
VLVERIQAFRRDLPVHPGGALPPYSEHLSYCADDGHLYDLLPIPFTFDAARYVARRVRQVQELLGERIALENSSYYAAPGQELTELEFIQAVLAEADCELLLDVNNLYVNSRNHGYDPEVFLRGLPLERVRYLHVAGHYAETESAETESVGAESAETESIEIKSIETERIETGGVETSGVEPAAVPPLLIDTHGAAVIAPVWRLLETAYRWCGPLPTLLERDFNWPPLAELLGEVDAIRALQQGASAERPTARREPG